MITLAIDASTYTGTVAIVAGEEIVASIAAPMRGATEEHLMPAVASAITDAGLQPAWVERVVCGSGPGSFTSLRISASIAKGMCTGLERPLFAVPSLALMIAGASLAGRLSAGRYLAVLDALRGECYAAPYVVEADGSVSALDCGGGAIRVLAAPEVRSWAAALSATVVGPGQPVDATPQAAGIARLEGMLREAGPVDLASWEPAYGRKAEAQVRWETAHGRPLPLG